jgi:hypothetical protein
MAMHPQTAVAMGNLLQRLAGNPKTRQKQLELVRELDPSYRLPGDVQINQLENKLRAEHQAEKQKEAQERWQRNRGQARRRLVESHGEDTVKEIEEKILKKYPHLTYDDAAKLHAAEDRPVTPTNKQPQARHGQIWEFPVPDGMPAEQFLKNVDKAAIDTAHSVIDRIRAGERLY